jgi:hypothetical protein
MAQTVSTAKNDPEKTVLELMKLVVQRRANR